MSSHRLISSCIWAHTSADVDTKIGNVMQSVNKKTMLYSESLLWPVFSQRQLFFFVRSFCLYCCLVVVTASVSRKFVSVSNGSVSSTGDHQGLLHYSGALTTPSSTLTNLFSCPPFPDDKPAHSRMFILPSFVCRPFLVLVSNTEIMLLHQRDYALNKSHIAIVAVIIIQQLIQGKQPHQQFTTM